MRRGFRFLKWFVSILIVVSILTSGGGYLYLRRSLPQVEGRIRVAGLHAPVDIIRDVDAVPHIYAQNKLDAMFGLGYVHAQDRLWQMEIWRRISQGRFAEIFGERALDADRFLRTIGLQRAGQRAWEKLPTETKETVNAYVAGINAFVASHHGADLAPEFTILNIDPEPWTGVDALAWAKIFAWDLAGNFWTELLTDDLTRQLGAERTRQLLPGYPHDGPTVVARDGDGVASEDLIQLWRSVRQYFPGMAGAYGGAIGSNAWVVDGTKSTTGKPLLANDPHLTLDIPGWYQAHLSAGDFEVMGATIPGLPGVVIGRNRSIAWGLTALNADVEDLYRERLDPTGRMAEFKGQWEPIQIINETIKVKGAPDVQQIIRVTRHGPLISDALNAEEAGQPTDLRSPTPREPLALRWTGSDADDTTVAAFLAIDEAQNWDAFRQALRKFVALDLNVVYADTAGNIGYSLVGRIPIRASGKGALPVEGHSGANEWVGSIPFDDLPHAYNPPQHFIVTANNRPVSDGYPYFLGWEWFPHYRAQRISDLLQAKARLSPDDFAAIQGDTVSLQARELLPKLLALTTPQNDQQRRAIEFLKGWDGDTRSDSTAAAIYEMWFAGLPRAIAGDELAYKRRIVDYESNFTFTSRFLNTALAERTNPWCDDITTPEREDCAAIVGRALDQALQRLKTQLGANMAEWQWGRLHQVVFFHQPFDQVAVLRPFFSRSRPNGGDWSTVDAGAFPAWVYRYEERYDRAYDLSQRFGPSYRQIIELSSPPGGRFIQAIGESGHFLSPHYDDYMDDFLALRYRPMRFERTAVEQNLQATLRLEPE
jgi:penicillin G amidase